MRRATLITVLLSSVLALSACETVKGMGEDIQNAGTAIKKSTSG